MMESLKRWPLMAGLAAVIAALAIAMPPPASAQVPQPGDCQLPPPSSLPALPDPTQLAQQLATALNLPLATVQQALASLSSQPFPGAPLPPFQDPISAAAAQLGVPREQLRSAVQAADQAIEPGFALQGSPAASSAGLYFTGGPTAGTGPSGGPLFVAIGCAGPIGGDHPDPTTFFADVAQQLGPGFSGQQVESAFVSTAPLPPDPSRLQAFQQQRLSGLASALGVSVSALTAAFGSMGYPNGCLPPGIGGISFSKSVPPPIGAGSDSGPIFIPLPGPKPPPLPAVGGGRGCIIAGPLPP